MKSIFLTTALLATSFAYSAEEKVITKAIINNATTAGRALNSYKSMEECVAAAKRDEAKLKSAGYKIFENTCADNTLPDGWGAPTPSFINDLKFF